MIACIAVHPRVCGEHESRLRRLMLGLGSSPRVRGTLQTLLLSDKSARFIPACAGNTRNLSQHQPRLSVHPRVCGEHQTPSRGGATNPGSSPRVRGTLQRDDPDRAIRRFIPACAGNTPRTRRRILVTAVHPRVCGEHVVRVEVKAAKDGSSPRVRGTHRSASRCPPPPRFIPACAGNTPAIALNFFRAPVHPRVCGEHSSRSARWPRNTGSSPRVRGTPNSPTCWRWPTRFIPACAGNTAGDHRLSAR